MDKYKFKLEKLLDIRKEKEDLAKKEFMEARREQAKIQNALEELLEKQKKYKVSNAQETVIERKIRNNYLTALSGNISSVQAALEKKNREVEVKRQEAAARQIDRKTVEKLKEKGLEAFNKEQEHIEQNANDEFALFGYMRNHEGR